MCEFKGLRTLKVRGGAPSPCRVPLEEAWLVDPNTLWVNQRSAKINCMEEEPQPCRMPLEVSLGDPDNLSVDHRSANFQKYHRLVACLSRKLYSEIPIVYSQIKGLRMLKVRREPKLLPWIGLGYWFLHIYNILKGQRGHCHHRYSVRKSKVRECGKCGESRTALSRASRRSLARRSHKTRVTRESSRLFGRRYKEQEISAHLHCVSSQRRTDIASVFTFYVAFPSLS